MELNGFFCDSEIPSLKDEISAPKCGKCGFDKHCNSPRMKWTGDGAKGVLICAESPGKEEDKQGVQLVGASGQLLRRHLRSIGVSLDRDCWKTNAICCHPVEEATDRQIANAIQCCRPNLLRAIKELQPHVVILLGGVAIRSLISYLWKEDEGSGGVGRWVGWNIPHQPLNVWICPTYHPAAMLHQPDPVKELWFVRHLRAAFKHGRVPWMNGPPNLLSKVERVFDAEEAASRIRRMIDVGGLFSFDYETDRLKPDADDASIVSCAICRSGEETIAFPWMGEAIDAMGEFAQSSHPKIGWNARFEQRWTKRVFGYGARNWVYDGMIGTHVLDSRSLITGAKFQAFVTMGQEPWDVHVGPYLEADGGGNSKNRIKQVNVRDLLLYNGMDALLEWLVDRKQMKSLGIWEDEWDVS